MIVGASADPAKWGNAIAVQALRGVDRHRVHLVNRRGGTVLGRPCLASVEDLPEDVDVAVVAVPETGFEEAVRASLDRGAKAIVAITAGLAESGEAGRRREVALIAEVRSRGAVLVGPNCLGVVDNTTGTFLASNPFGSGGVAVLSQSGNLALELDRLLAARGLGMSRFVSLGNQADLTLVDLVSDCAKDPATTAIAIYVEDFHDGRTFVSAAAAAVDSGTPVVVLAAGTGPAAARGAQSHTGSLTSADAVIAAACDVAGVIRVHTPRELADVLLALGQQPRAAGARVGILTDGGGHGVIACDVAEGAGLQVPVLNETTAHRLKESLWAQSSVHNPVDMAGAGEHDPHSYARAFGVLADAPEVDAILMTGYFGGYSGDVSGLRGLAGAECDTAKEILAQERDGKPVAVQSIFPDSPACRILTEGGIPVYAAIEDAARALAAVSRPARTARVQPVPPPSAPVGELDYTGARQVFADLGIPFPPAREVRCSAEVTAAAAELRPPYALKAVGLLHKSDAGGVVLGLPDAAALQTAYAELLGRLDPTACSVEEMADLTDSVELIVGSRWDPRFGPTVLVGMGGTASEVLRDVRTSLGPVDEEEAARMLGVLRGAAILGEYRGRAPLDVAAAARVVAQLSRFGAEHPDVSELEINPLLVRRSGVLALDARVVVHSDNCRSS